MTIIIIAIINIFIVFITTYVCSSVIIFVIHLFIFYFTTFIIKIIVIIIINSLTIFICLLIDFYFFVHSLIMACFFFLF